MRTLSLVVALSLVACGSKGGGTPPRAPEPPVANTAAGSDPRAEPAKAPGCDAAMTNAFELSRNDPGMDANAKLLDKMKVVMTDHCKADVWPAEVVACFATAADSQRLKGCMDTLPKPAVDKLMKDVMELVMAEQRDASGSAAGATDGSGQ